MQFLNDFYSLSNYDSDDHSIAKQNVLFGIADFICDETFDSSELPLSSVFCLHSE